MPTLSATSTKALRDWMGFLLLPCWILHGCCFAGCKYICYLPSTTLADTVSRIPPKYRNESSMTYTISSMLSTVPSAALLQPEMETSHATSRWHARKVHCFSDFEQGGSPSN